MKPELFFKMYAPYAIATQAAHGVPASITLAQAALESGWGESELTKTANNFFGIKDQAKDEYKGPNVTRDTTEYINGVKVTVNSAFRRYSTPQGSFNDHSVFLLKNSRYKNLFKIPLTDFEAWAKGLKAAGYATDPNYANKLITLVKAYNLNQYTEQGILKKKL